MIKVSSPQSFFAVETLLIKFVSSSQIVVAVRFLSPRSFKSLAKFAKKFVALNTQSSSPPKLIKTSLGKIKSFMGLRLRRVSSSPLVIGVVVGLRKILTVIVVPVIMLNVK